MLTELEESLRKTILDYKNPRDIPPNILQDYSNVLNIIQYSNNNNSPTPLPSMLTVPTVLPDSSIRFYYSPNNYFDVNTKKVLDNGEVGLTFPRLELNEGRLNLLGDSLTNKAEIRINNRNGKTDTTFSIYNIIGKFHYIVATDKSFSINLPLLLTNQTITPKLVSPTSTPEGYVKININGKDKYIPYYS